MKMTCKKLKKLEDPESVLCKAVLINNTLKHLQTVSNQINLDTQTTICEDSEKLFDRKEDKLKEKNIDEILHEEILFPPTSQSEPNLPSQENFIINFCEPGSLKEESVCHQSDGSEDVPAGGAGAAGGAGLLGAVTQSEYPAEQPLPQSPQSSLINLCCGCSSDHFISGLQCSPLHRIVCQV